MFFFGIFEYRALKNHHGLISHVVKTTIWVQAVYYAVHPGTPGNSSLFVCLANSTAWIRCLYLLFSAICCYRSPQACIIKLDWVVETSFLEELRSGKRFDVQEGAKTCSDLNWSRSSQIACLVHLWQISVPNKAIWANYDLKRMQSEQYFACRC